LEVRDKIHERVLDDKIYIDIQTPKVKYASQGAAWIQTCSQIYQECAEIYYRDVVLMIAAPIFDPTSRTGLFTDNIQVHTTMLQRLRSIGKELLWQQKCRPHMTPHRVRLLWGVIGSVDDEADEELNDSWIEARDLIVDFFYWVHYLVPKIKLSVYYSWKLECGKRVYFVTDTRVEQYWHGASFTLSGPVEQLHLSRKEVETLALWNSQLKQWAHSRSQSRRVQRLRRRGAPIFPCCDHDHVVTTKEQWIFRRKQSME
jgi:hypothetical protein